MKALDIPVRVVGPDSQAEEDSLQYLAVPREMDVFRMPEVPQRADTRALCEARDVLNRFADRFAAWDIGSATAGPRLALDGLPPATLRVLNQVLGEGEVSVRVDAPRPCASRRAYSPASGACASSTPTGAWLAIGSKPRRCRLRQSPPRTADGARCAPIPDLPPCDELARAPARDRGARARATVRQPGAGRSILRCLPLTPEDHKVIELALPVGPVAIMSRGFGDCGITSTERRTCCRVQYFNTMNTLILNTLEVVDAPEVALAATDDLADSRERFGELLAWMAEDIASAGNG